MSRSVCLHSCLFAGSLCHAKVRLPVVSFHQVPRFDSGTYKAVALVFREHRCWRFSNRSNASLCCLSVTCKYQKFNNVFSCSLVLDKFLSECHLSQYLFLGCWSMSLNLGSSRVTAVQLGWILTLANRLFMTSDSTTFIYNKPTFSAVVILQVANSR